MVTATVTRVADQDTATAAIVATVAEAKAMVMEALVAMAAMAGMVGKEATMAMVPSRATCHQLPQRQLQTRTTRPLTRMLPKHGLHTTSKTLIKTPMSNMVVTKHILPCSSSSMRLTMLRPVMDKLSRLLQGPVPLHHLHHHLPSLHRLAIVLPRHHLRLLLRLQTTARYVYIVSTRWSQLTCH